MVQTVKNPPAIQETWVQSLGCTDPLEKGMATHSSILDWRILHGRRSLAGHSPWGPKESDMTERPTLSRFSLSVLSHEHFIHFHTLSHV